MRTLLTQCFRGYAVVTVLVAGFTALWALGVIEMSLPLVGYAWLIVAAAGTVVTVGMWTTREETIALNADGEQIKRFEDASVTGRPLELYIGALAAWAAVSFGWVLGGMSISGLTLVGYGWLVIALYGLVVGAGIAMNHREDIAAVISSTESIETDREPVK
jgi:hypothetical protein